MTTIDSLNQRLAARGCDALNSEQVALLLTNDETLFDERDAMIADLEDRVLA